MSFYRALCKSTVLVLVLQLVACSPVLDWRELRVAETPFRLLLPCRAHAQDRTIQLAGQPVLWRLHVCSAGDHTFGVAWADLRNPALVGLGLKELFAAAAANVAASSDTGQAVRVPGATPHAGSQQAMLTGRRSDGRAIQMQVAVFAYGTAVFQVTVLGPSIGAEISDPLMDSLRFQP